MRILLASSWPFHGEGGIQTYRRTLQRGLVLRGHQVDLLWHDAGLRATLHSDGRRWPDAPDDAFSGVDDRLRWTEVLGASIETACSRLGLAAYDVVHTQDAISSAAVSRALAQGVAHVTTLHGSLVEEMRIALGAAWDDAAAAHYTRLEHQGALAAHRTLVPAASLRAQLNGLSQVPADEILVLAYGIDIALLQAQSLCGEPLKAEPDVPIVFSPARLAPVKNPLGLLQAAGLLRRKGKRFSLWLAGSGDSDGEMRRAARELGIADRVRFLGYRADVASLIRQCDVVALNSLQEVLPFALLEAQVLGKPVAATRVGGVPEAVDDGSTGLLCDPGRPGEMAAAIARLLDGADLRAAFGRAAALRAQRLFAAHGMIDRTIEVYAEAMRRCGARAVHAEQARQAVPVQGRSPAIYPQPTLPSFGTRRPTLRQRRQRHLR